MIRRATRLAPPALLLLPLAGALPGAAEQGERTLTGEYRSGYGRGPLEARFTADGARRWRVTFDFEFNRRWQSYSGTAEGSLSGGRLSGRVKNESGRRTFTFRGEFQDGVFRGTHAEVYRSRERDTGTLTLAE